MLDDKGFDLWADGYDKSVQLSEEDNEYPFAGYKDVLNTIYNIIHRKEKAKVLDIGFGTGVLTKNYMMMDMKYMVLTSQRECWKYQREMPLAKLVQYDFSRGLPKELENIQFDYIISTYAMHHLEDEDKIKFINKLEEYLSRDGRIIIGDIAFETRELLEQCKVKYENYWDDEEIYFVFDELKEFFLKKILVLQLYPLCRNNSA